MILISVHFLNYYKYISGLRSEKVELDLNLTRNSPELGIVRHVAALPGGKAVITNYMRKNKTEEVVKLDSQGRVTQVIYPCVNCSISGLLVLGDHLYITHYNGTVMETRVSDGHVLSITAVPDVISVIHRGSSYSKPSRIPDKQTLLLCDNWKGEVFTFKPSTGQKQVRITGLRFPIGVSYLFYNHSVYYIVCEQWGHRITVYNNTWDHIRTIGRRGSGHGELNNPISAIVSNEDTIIISDYWNHRVAEFSFNGTFLRHLLIRADSDRPVYMSYNYPHLWLTHGDYPLYKLYRYNLYG